MYLFNVAKRYNNINKNHRKHCKKYWHIYFYDESGLFRSKRITFLKAWYYRLFVPKFSWHIRTCKNCHHKVKTLGVYVACANCGKDLITS